ncbi:MAG: 50S ribosomal protein L21e [Candidatus Njordarchaeota archaeon]
MRGSKGPRSRTRKLFSKSPKERGLPPISAILYQYKVGEKVVIKIDPSIQKGMPYKRFHGKVGTIIDKRGRSYIVLVKDGNKEKKVIARPEHLRPIGTKLSTRR